MKQCFKCLELKDISYFYPHPKMKDGHLNKCRSCTLLDRKATYDSCDKAEKQKYNRSREALSPNKLVKKDKRYKKMCGVGLEWIAAKFKEQKGLCAICKKPGDLVLDHNHTTLSPRGLLHRTCNSGLGLLGDNFDFLLSAAKYLQEHDGVI